MQLYVFELREYVEKSGNPRSILYILKYLYSINTYTKFLEREYIYYCRGGAGGAKRRFGRVPGET